MVSAVVALLHGPLRCPLLLESPLPPKFVSPRINSRPLGSLGIDEARVKVVLKGSYGFPSEMVFFPEKKPKSRATLEIDLDIGFQ